MTKCLIAALLLSVITTNHASTYQQRVDASRAALGKPIQQALFYNQEQQSMSWESLAGKETVVYFFAAWCAPCYGTLSNLQSVTSQNTPSVRTLAVSLDDSAEKMVRMLEKTGYQGEVWRAIDAKKVLREKLFANFAGALPYAIKISADGRLVEHSYELKSESQWQQALLEGVPLGEIL